MRFATAMLLTSALVFYRADHVSRAQAPVSAARDAPSVLLRDEVERILPPSVFYGGQSATLQGRNSAGLRMANSKLVLVALVDTSGYSSGVAEGYQAYLITEVSLRIGEGHVAPGAYGFGFIAGDRMVIMDLGRNELLQTATRRDTMMKRPAPLQILFIAGQYRLYLGRSFVALTPEERSN